MRYVSIDNVEPGMLLARAVFDSEDRILLGAQVELTHEFIDKLRGRGYAGVYIDDELSKDICIEETISQELRRQGVESLRECNVDAVLDVAKNIVEQILSAKAISLDLVDLRSFDDYTFYHSVNVAVLSTVIGIGMGLTEKAMTELCIAAIFHDLGKCRIDPRILNKPARLTKEEFTRMRKHSEYSYDLIKSRLDISAMTKKAILCHHENEDGSGYPLGLAGDEIPLYDKIIHVADVYDALTAKRPYKEPYVASEALEYLMGGCGILFNQKVVEAFIEYVPLYPKGMEVMLSDGRRGIVIENNNKNTLRPKIRLTDGTEVDLSETQHNRNITVSPVESVNHKYSRDVVKEPLMENRVHILAVDDDGFSRKTLYGILEHQYKVTTLDSGEQAIRFLQTNPKPDLILMDVEMGGISGVETARWIRENIEEEIPIIFVTGVTDQKIVQQCRELQARDYIVKPYKPIYVQECIRKALLEDPVVNKNSRIRQKLR